MAKRYTSTPGPYLHRATLLPERVADRGKYPFSLPAFRTFTAMQFHPKVTFFVGENGSGKSTLLEALAVGCDLNPEGGSRNFRFTTRASHSNLVDALRLSKTVARPADSYFLRAESYFNLATEIERLDEEPGAGPPVIGAYGGVPLHEQSHGESFFALFRNRFRANGLYFLDEPEAALSPTRQLQFVALLHDYCSRGCQFIIATHSPLILAYPPAEIYHFGREGISRMAYDRTEHYLVAKEFFADPGRAMEKLISPAADQPSP